MLNAARRSNRNSSKSNEVAVFNGDISKWDVSSVKIRHLQMGRIKHTRHVWYVRSNQLDNTQLNSSHHQAKQTTASSTAPGKANGTEQYNSTKNNIIALQRLNQTQHGSSTKHRRDSIKHRAAMQSSAAVAMATASQPNTAAIHSSTATPHPSKHRQFH